MHRAYRYVIGSRGIHMEYYYPYTSGSSRRSGSCQDGRSGYRFKITSYSGSSRYSCSSMRYKIRSGPGSVALCVNRNFQYYRSGTFNGCSGCTSINHAVLIYGYTSYGTWRVKNSWGRNWGMSGHMYLRSGNTCNVCKYGAEVVKY